MKKAYHIEVDCANCANKMEEAIRTLPYVKEASIHFMTLRLMVEWEGAEESVLRKEITALCKKIDRDFTME